MSPGLNLLPGWWEDPSNSIKASQPHSKGSDGGWSSSSPILAEPRRHSLHFSCWEELSQHSQVTSAPRGTRAASLPTPAPPPALPIPTYFLLFASSLLCWLLGSAPPQAADSHPLSRRHLPLAWLPANRFVTWCGSAGAHRCRQSGSKTPREAPPRNQPRCFQKMLLSPLPTCSGLGPYCHCNPPWPGLLFLQVLDCTWEELCAFWVTSLCLGRAVSRDALNGAPNLVPGQGLKRRR